MEEQQTPTAGTPIYQESQQKNAKWLWLLIVLIIIGALAFAYFRRIGPFANFRIGSQSEDIIESPSPQVFSTPSPESSPTANLDRSELEIRILNGSGKAGAASTVKDFLEGKGYKVGKVGNAENYDFTQTVLRFKQSLKAFQELMVSDMSDDYSVSVSTDDLDATDSADVEVIVGTK